MSKSRAVEIVNLHGRLMKVAREEASRHVVDDEEDEPGKVFNLYTFLEAMASRVDTILSGRECPTGRFELDPTTVARYLWCCLALEEGGAADGDTFMGHPIAD